jgi:precorrin-2 dehydrogenase/sirohydrochlorin ferrochelatase
MPLFPLFINIKHKKVLVVGAGQVAARKIEKLLPFEAHLKVVAKNITTEVEQWSKVSSNNIELHCRGYEESDLDQIDFAIIAADDIELQKKIYALCFERKIPINCVDSPEYCSFIFPALIVDGDVTIAINTAGKAPGLSRFLRQKIENYLPNDLNEIVNILSAFRKEQKEKGLSFTERAVQFESMAKSLLDNKFFPEGSPRDKTKKDQD